MAWTFWLAGWTAGAASENVSATACSAETLTVPSERSLPGVTFCRAFASGSSADSETSESAPTSVRAAEISPP